MNQVTLDIKMKQMDVPQVEYLALKKALEAQVIENDNLKKRLEQYQQSYDRL